MTKRNIARELCYSHNIDMEYGDDTDTIDYQSLFGLFGELIDRIEELEKRLIVMKNGEPVSKRLLRKFLQILQQIKT